MFSRRCLEVRVSKGVVVVTDRRRGRQLFSEEHRFGDVAGLTEVLSGLGEVVRRRRLSRWLLVTVEQPLLQRRVLNDLPPVRQQELTRLLSRAPGRYFRQNGHPLVSAAMWAGNGDPAHRQALAVALEAPVAEAIVTGSHRAGLELRDIVPSEGPPLSLLPFDERARRRRREWIAVARLAGAVVLASGAIATYVTVRLRTEAERLGAELTRLREPREALTRARLTMDSASAMLVALDRAEAARAVLGARLSGVVAALPESTSLTTLTIDSAAATMTGRTRRLSRLVPAMERSLPQVRLEGRSARDTVAGVVWERFNLTSGPRSAP